MNSPLYSCDIGFIYGMSYNSITFSELGTLRAIKNAFFENEVIQPIICHDNSYLLYKLLTNTSAFYFGVLEIMITNIISIKSHLSKE